MTRPEFKPGGVDKFTVVMWQGDDPDCTDELIGGVFKTRNGYQDCKERSAVGIIQLIFADLYIKSG